MLVTNSKLYRVSYFRVCEFILIFRYAILYVCVCELKTIMIFGSLEKYILTAHAVRNIRKNYHKHAYLV